MTEPEDEEYEYNRVFETLVSSHDDLVGLIAYALYKAHKRDWIIEIKKKRDPTPGDMEAFLASVITGLESYRERARAALVEYGNGYVDDARPQIAMEAIEGRIAEAAHKVEASGGWRRQIGVGVASSVITTALLVLLTFAAQATGIDLIDLLRTVSPT